MAQNQSDQAVSDHQQQPELFKKVAKIVTAMTLGGSLIVLSAIALFVAIIFSPVLIIFSPVLLPAAFIFGGGIYWVYRYATGKHPIGADQLDQAREKIAETAEEVKNKVEQLGQEAVEGGGGGRDGGGGGESSQA